MLFIFCCEIVVNWFVFLPFFRFVCVCVCIVAVEDVCYVFACRHKLIYTLTFEIADQCSKIRLNVNIIRDFHKQVKTGENELLAHSPIDIYNEAKYGGNEENNIYTILR